MGVKKLKKSTCLPRKTFTDRKTGDSCKAQVH